MNYTVEYFIEKFEAIPEENWCVGTFTNNEKKCALGHCGGSFNKPNSQIEELCSLFNLLKDNLRALTAAVNDGADDRYQQPTPKQRILAALHDIKANQAVTEATDIINSNPSPANSFI